MAYTSTSGKRFGSAFAGRKKDEMDSQKEGSDAKNPFGSEKSVAAKGPAMPPVAGAKPPMAPPVAGAKPPMAPPVAGAAGPEPPKDPHAVVSEHGPASSVHITHDHAAKKHHVTSTHADGHVHNSDHASAQEANEAGSQLGGVEKPEAGPQEAEGGAPEEDGFNMPSLG
jgi:hypothetical protein